MSEEPRSAALTGPSTTTGTSPRGPSRGTNGSASADARPGAGARLDALVRRARLALAWEKLWPALWWPLGVLGAFATLSFLGLWLELPAVGRAIGCGIAALVLIASLVPLLRLRSPTRHEALDRLDRDAGTEHRPATAIDDALAIGHDDPATRALWAAHRRRAVARLDALKVRAPAPGMAGRDRFALRAAVIVTLVASTFVAGPEMLSRLKLAFDWRGLDVNAANVRIDGWVDPPLYTRLPPLILDIRSAASEPIRVRAPVNSTLVLRAAGAPLSVSGEQGLKRLAEQKATRPGLDEQRFTILGPGKASVGAGGTRAGLVVEAIPDKPPEIAFADQPQANARGSLTVAYKAKDDYGIAAAEGIVERAEATGGRPLVPPPVIGLSLPGDLAGEAETRTTADLSAHPWAGAKVRLTLVARDDAGQEGRSATLALTLPQRPFTKPLARALVEQRRNLVVDADQRRRVQTALDALSIAPEMFTPEPGIYLGLKFAADSLRSAASDADLVEVADYLWQMAVEIEDGDLSDAEKALRAAQENLRQALERGAGEEEIKKLTEALRQALDRFISEFAERQRQDGNHAQAQPADPNTRTVTPDDLKNMLNRLEELAQQGNTAEAQRLLDELRNILENLRTAEPGRQQNPMARELNRSLDELDQLMRDQQALRDETYRNGQERNGQERNADQRMRRGQRQGEAGPQGERQRGGQRRSGRSGETGEEAQDGQGQQGQSGDLSQRQQALRERLQDLQRRLKGLGMEGEQGLDDAGDEMRDAEGSLGQGRSGEAVDSQGRALEAMRRGIQGLAQQMQGQGEGTADADGSEGAQGRPSGRAQNGAGDTDPLGRPTRNRDWADGRVKIPNSSESAVVRARRILDELRRRLSEPERPQEELDYLERLLRQR